MGKQGRKKAARADEQPAVVKDPRFSIMHSKPVFKKMARANAKVVLDKRFKAVLTDKRFATGHAGVDKYGRKTKRKDAKDEMKAFYTVEDAEGDGEGGAAAEKGLEDADAAAEDPEARVQYLNALARGEIEGDSSEDDSEEDDDDDDDAGVEDDAIDTEGLEVGDDVRDMGALARQGAEEEEEVPMGEATKRVAILNVDWQHMQAVDLLACVQSLTSGTVRRVTVYPSDFGLEQMAIENKFGPQGLWAEEDTIRIDKPLERQPEKLQAADADSEDSEGEDADGGVDASGSDDDEDASGSDGDEDAWGSDGDEDGSSAEEDARFDGDFVRADAGLVVEQDGRTPDGFDKEKLREYEVKKLRYYFAIAECDTVRTALAVADEVDGMEFESSSSRLDIRFVPDDTSFKDRQVRDTATTVPDDYEPPLYVTTALQQSNITCTWDEPDTARTNQLTQYGAWAEMNTEDLAVYMASDESEEDDVDPAERRKKRALLLGDAADDDDDDDENEDDSGDDLASGANGADSDGEGGDREITFTVGAKDKLKEKVARIASGEGEAQLTPFEQYQLKRREKKRQRRAEVKERRRIAKEESDGFFLDDADGAAAEGGGASAQEVSIQEAVGYDSGSDDERDYDMREIQRSERMKGKKLTGARKRKEKLRKERVGDVSGGDFGLDLQDDRFAPLLEGDQRFGVDPTSKEFKDTEGMRDILREQRRRRKKAEEDAAKRRRDGKPQRRDASSRDGDVSDLANRIKAGAAKKKKNRTRKKKK